LIGAGVTCAPFLAGTIAFTPAAMLMAAGATDQAAGAAAGVGQSTAQAPAPTKRPDVIYVPTQPVVVDAMLKLAKVAKGDVVYDLGCGDGRIVVAAARDYGATGVGIDIDPVRIAEATANVKENKVEGKVKILQQDLFETDFSKANVVTLYLLQTLNEKLKPKLLKELKPGSRVVSHAFSMGADWPPEQTVEVGGTTIYLWTIPNRSAKQ
jgi:SAM-dependent methyltransferase